MTELLLSLTIGVVLCILLYLLVTLVGDPQQFYNVYFKFFEVVFSKFRPFTKMGELRDDNPSVEEQKSILSCKLAKSVVTGETWYLVNSKWVKNLKQFIGMLKSTGPCDHPGPIDNACILAENRVDLKKGLAENIDYELVSEECWNLLVDWYGFYEDQNPISRKAIPAGVNYTMIEVYLVELRCYRSFDLRQELKIAISKAEMLATLHNLIREKYNLKNCQKSRLWLSVRKDHFDLLKLEDTVQRAGLSDGHSIIIDVQSPGGQWAKNRHEEKSSSTDLLYSQPSTSRQLRTQTLISSNSKRPSVQAKKFNKPGICGLFNLGNTCFMNSVLQCLSNSSPVTEYFLSGCHMDELNVNNPLGMHGEIAKAYGDLVNAIWSGRYSSTNPLNFKVQVSRFNPQFYGCQQHDAQELLTFLLDGLHEDLNRIIDKPYVPNKDYVGQEDHILAEESWRNYKLRNDSIIVDTFHGMLKSRVICPQCERLSVAFDPFCSLSLPLPQTRDFQINVKYIPFSPKKNEVIYRVYLPKKSLVKDLCHELSFITDADPTKMVVAEVINSHIHRFFSPGEGLDFLQEKDVLNVFEVNIDPFKNMSDYIIIPVCFWERSEPTDAFSYSQLFGFPVLTVFPRDNIDTKKLVATIVHMMSRHFLYNSDSDSSTSSSDTDFNSFSPTIYLLDVGSSNGYPVKIEYNGSGDEEDDLCEVFETDPEDVFSRKIVLVQFLMEEKYAFYAERPADIGISSSNYKDWSTVVINDCFDLFTTCEKLGVENAWYCPTCKVHQRATKKFDLWKLPKILIIHLKRFSYSKAGGKIDSFVEFPLVNLRLAKYIINPQQQEVTFNLVGVINHYGSMSGGHYTACCKNKNNDQWYCFDDEYTTLINEDDVLSQAAYVLFYKRNDGYYVR